MKTIRTMLALLLSVVLMVSTGVSTLGAEYENIPTPAGGFTVTINPNAKDKGTHTYEAYRILAGTLAQQIDENGQPVKNADGTIVYVLSDIVWGNGITTAGRVANGGDTREAARAYAKKLESGELDPVTAAAALEQYLGEKSGTYANGVITGLQPGFYLIQDAATSPVDNTEATRPASKTKFILQVVANETVTVKSSVPEVEKKVKEKNDTTGDETEWQDAADYDIGDVIPYKITATIGKGIEFFDGYSLEFVDDMSKGLTLNEGWTIKIGDLDITSSFTKKTQEGSTYEGGTVHVWSIKDLRKAVPSSSSSTEPDNPSEPLPDETEAGPAQTEQPEEVAAGPDNNQEGGSSGETGGDGTTGNTGTEGGEGSGEGTVNTETQTSAIQLTEGTQVVLEYTATLNENAVIGSAGNPNKTYIKFDNNPNHCGEGEPGGTTPEDKVTVFTYQINVLKVHSIEDISEAAYNALSEDEQKAYTLIDGKYMKTEPLQGAGFTLFKNVAKAASTTTGEQTGGTEGGAEGGSDAVTPAVEGEGGSTGNEGSGNDTGATTTEPDAGTTVPEGSNNQNDGEGGENTQTPENDTPEPASEENWVAVGEEITGVTTFEFKGVDAGEYKLVETTVPAGYDRIDDIVFEVIATYDTDSPDPKLLSLTTDPAERFTITITETKVDDKNEVTEIVTNGVITTTVLNIPGSRLPSVGGRGTVAFYLIGGAMVIGAAAMLVMKRRRREEE